MRVSFRPWRALFVLAALAIVVVTAGASNTVAPDQLPEPVAKTFKAVFPAGTIDKLTASEENGTTVYDFEFHVPGREMETDIIADGTMIESTVVITMAAIPAKPLGEIKKAAKGAKYGRLEWIHTLFEVEEGKAVRLDPPLVSYAAEMRRRDQMAEIIVAASGKVLEPPVWVTDTTSKAPPAK